MGYSTDFRGQFNLDKPLTEAHRAYLSAFNETRRMNRDQIKTARRPDRIREAVGLSVGKDGGYFVGESGFLGQDHGSDVVDFNTPPRGQPGQYCQWTPNEAGTAIVWDQNEKFDAYVPWLKYLIEHFLEPWGYTLNGKVVWQGDEMGDRGRITVSENTILVEGLE